MHEWKMHSILIIPHCLPSQKLSMYHSDFIGEMNKQNPADWFASMKRLSAILYFDLKRWKAFKFSNCFSKLGLGWFKVIHFSSSLWMCQIDGFEVLQQFPKCIEAELRMSAKCVNVLWQLTVLSVCLRVCEWSLPPLGVKTEQRSVDTGR